MLALYRNNRMESLLRELGDVLSVPRADPFRPEVVIVQSLGMERWLSMGLARRLGVWANGRHPFPRAFIEEVLSAVLGPVPDANRWSKERLTYVIAELLDTLPEEPGTQTLRNYVQARTDVDARLELAAEIADAFDQAQVYRPEWFTDWEDPHFLPKANDFRPTLYRQILARLGRYHFPARLAELLRVLKSDNASTFGLPSRVCLFGVATLPPSFLRVFEALSSKVMIHWFLLTASQEYLGDELGKRELLRTTFGGSGRTNLLREVQPLLVSFGRMMRDMGQLLEQECHYEDESKHPFFAAEPGRILSTLQADVCTLQRRGTGGELPRLAWDASDDSIGFHSCHGPRRELEVIRELLLDGFERDPSLRPEDVIVLLRDVDLYAPLVRSVFSATPGEPGAIAYNLADSSLATGNAVAEALARILHTAGQRLTVGLLESLLELEIVRNRFSLSTDEALIVKSWLASLGARWGVDGAERVGEGLPDESPFTLRFGLERLLLGVAMDESASVPPFGRQPYGLGPDESVVAGKFADFAETLFTLRRSLAQSKTLGDWTTFLKSLLEAMVLVQEKQSWQLTELQGTLSTFAADAQQAGFLREVPVRYVAKQLRLHFEQTRSARTFLSGGVTFCASLPMRGIPARWVILVGLDDGSFPRSSRASSFDDIAREPRVGDRIAREEDRHLFLESLLAARERFIITYCGRSARDDSARPPSVVVEELKAVIDDSFGLPGGGEANAPAPATRVSAALTVQHPMHAQSPRYFDRSDTRLKQSSQSAYRAALSSLRSEREPTSWQVMALSQEPLHEAKLSQLERFWSGPGEAFWQMRLKAQLERDVAPVEPLDPLTFDGLARFGLMDEMFLVSDESAELELLRARYRAGAKSPAGSFGDVTFDRAWEATRHGGRIYRALSRGRRARRLPVDLRIEGLTLSGTIGDLFDSVRLDWAVAQMKPKQRIRPWFRHLAASAGGLPVTTYVLRLSRDARKPIALERIMPLTVSESTSILEVLIRWTNLGLTLPLPFFPEVSYNYVHRLAKGEDADCALAVALREFGDPLGDSDDDFSAPAVAPAIARLYGRTHPVRAQWARELATASVPTFAELACGFWCPYVRCTQPVPSDELQRLLEPSAGTGAGGDARAEATEMAPAATPGGPPARGRARKRS